MSSITKAIFPVADDRLPTAARTNSGDMMRMVDTPLVRYAVDEAVASGVTEVIFVIGRNTRTVDGTTREAEAARSSGGDMQPIDVLKMVLPIDVTCVFVRQAQTLGQGHAVLCARPLVGDQPFAVILAADPVNAERGVLSQMVELYDCYRCCIVGVHARDYVNAGRSGLVSCDVDLGMVSRIAEVFDEPRRPCPSSARGVIGRYVLTPRIFHHLQALVPGPGGELKLTAAIRSLLREESVLAYQFRSDDSRRRGSLRSTLASVVRQQFARYARGFVSERPKMHADRFERVTLADRFRERLAALRTRP